MSRNIATSALSAVKATMDVSGPSTELSCSKKRPLLAAHLTSFVSLKDGRGGFLSISV